MKVHRRGMQFIIFRSIGRWWPQRAFEHSRVMRCWWLWPGIRLLLSLLRSRKLAVVLLCCWRTYVGTHAAAVTAPLSSVLVFDHFYPHLTILTIVFYIFSSLDPGHCLALPNQLNTEGLPFNLSASGVSVYLTVAMAARQSSAYARPDGVSKNVGVKKKIDKPRRWW